MSEGKKLLLAVDVGGTKIHAAIGRFDRESFVRVREARAATEGTPDLPAFLHALAGSERGDVAAVGVGIAGPVLGDRVRGANLPWEIDARDISGALGGAPVVLMNDLVASALGLETLAPDECVTIHAGSPRPHGNRALVSPGTGLGECILVRDGPRVHPIASEAGHADFAPRTDDEIDLLRFLRARFGRASAEHVVSGPGLVNVFDWLRESGRFIDDSGIASAGGESGPAEISARALAGSSRICVEALRMWVRALASEAGNVALRGLATGGVDLGGGIPAKVLPFLREPGAFDPFFAKPPQDELLRSIPIRVVTTPETTLRGAAIAARERAGASPREVQDPR